MAETDLSKIIELIMSHPEIISEIKGLVKADDKTSESAEVSTETAQSSSDDIITDEGTENAAQSTAAYIPAEVPKRAESERRGELLRALKPYVSEERGKAIESMLTIADILDVMRKK